jgi:hypothetical protein
VPATPGADAPVALLQMTRVHVELTERQDSSAKFHPRPPEPYWLRLAWPSREPVEDVLRLHVHVVIDVVGEHHGVRAIKSA